MFQQYLFHFPHAGYFMFTEASGSSSGDVALFETHPSLSTPDPQMCLTFWYHMFGDNMGSLLVYYRETDREEVKLWDQTGKEYQY